MKGWATVFLGIFFFGMMLLALFFWLVLIRR